MSSAGASNDASMSMKAESLVSFLEQQLGKGFLVLSYFYAVLLSTLLRVL